MKPNIKQKWVDALRSGDYKKHQGCLKDKDYDGYYCVMGVLCDLYIKETGEKWVGDSEEEGSISAFWLMPPPKVVEWAQDKPVSKLPNIEYRARSVTLGALNDDYDITLSEMADLIEQQL